MDSTSYDIREARMRTRERRRFHAKSRINQGSKRKAGFTVRRRNARVVLKKLMVKTDWRGYPSTGIYASNQPVQTCRKRKGQRSSESKQRKKQRIMSTRHYNYRNNVLGSDLYAYESDGYDSDFPHINYTIPWVSDSPAVDTHTDSQFECKDHYTTATVDLREANYDAWELISKVAKRNARYGRSNVLNPENLRFYEPLDGIMTEVLKYDAAVTALIFELDVPPYIAQVMLEFLNRDWSPFLGVKYGGEYRKNDWVPAIFRGITCPTKADFWCPILNAPERWCLELEVTLTPLNKNWDRKANYQFGVSLINAKHYDRQGCFSRMKAIPDDLDSSAWDGAIDSHYTQIQPSTPLRICFPLLAVENYFPEGGHNADYSAGLWVCCAWGCICYCEAHGTERFASKDWLTNSCLLLNFRAGNKNFADGFRRREVVFEGSEVEPGVVFLPSEECFICKTHMLKGMKACPSCHTAQRCPSGHRLETLDWGMRKDTPCVGCGRYTSKFGCKKCHIGACKWCCKVQPTYSTESPPECPDGHALTPFRTHRDGFGCDMCQAKFPEGTFMMSCRECNYDACTTCLPPVCDEEDEKAPEPEWDLEARVKFTHWGSDFPVSQKNTDLC